MSAIEKLHPEVVGLSGGELRRAAERTIDAIAQLDASTAEHFVMLTRDVWGGATVCELNGLRLLLDETRGRFRMLVPERCPGVTCAGCSVKRWW
ncbi:MAG: hypothetical protein IPK48_03255 [Gammaproteobacteria bacterium]|nr:hypothetical protein [Gammaproteobacteria bacterium]